MDRAEKKLAEIKENIETRRRGDYSPISLDELFRMEFPENAWAIERMIPLEGITIVSGAPESYKTWLVLLMAIAIAKGEKFLGTFPSSQHRVLIVDEENHLREVKRRLGMLKAPSNLPIFLISQKGFIMRDKELHAKVMRVCKENDIDVVFIDSLVRVNDAEENDATQMSSFFREVKKFCQKGITIVLIHHERKEGAIKTNSSSNLRGSSDILAAVDSHISVKKDREDDNVLVVEQSKLRCEKKLAPFEININGGGDELSFDYSGEQTKELGKQESAKMAIVFVLKTFPEGLNINHIVENVMAEVNGQIGDRTIRTAVRELIKSGRVLEKGGVKNEKICLLPPSEM
jgi:KaiC/GvpD/RAD55 family RecA-like ATPase